MSETESVERLTYSFEEVCTVLGVSERVVRQLIRRAHNPLPVIRSTARGGRIIISREALRQWLLDASARDGQGEHPAFALTSVRSGAEQKSGRR